MSLYPGYRTTDAVFDISQNNRARSIVLLEANGPACELLGYAPGDLVGKPLQELLPARIATLLGEYVEYEDDGNDVGTVLSRVQSFCVIDSKGKEVALRLKVLRSTSLDGNAHFRLILQGKSGTKSDQALRTMLMENFKGHEIIDAATGLPDRQSLAKDVELVLYYVHKGAINACFAIIDLDGYEKLFAAHGPDKTTQMVRHVARLARQNLRTDDTIGCLSLKRLGIILMDTTMEPARMVLNRLRWLVAANPFPLDNKDSVPLTVTIGYSSIGGRTQDKNLLGDLEYYMDHTIGSGGNTLAEIGEVEKRAHVEGEDRRKVNIPVAVDRRKGGDRRKR